MTHDLVDVIATVEGTVTAVPRRTGDEVDSRTPVVVVELMKLEQPVFAGHDGVLAELRVAVGDSIERGSVVAVVATGSAGVEPREAAPDTRHEDGDDTELRADLAALRARKRLVTDEARGDAVRRRHEQGGRTARENVEDLLDEGSFTEYGALAHAAQRARRDAEELQRLTPADGIVTGVGTIGAHDGTAADGADGPLDVAVAAYDYTVLAGTQGHTSHAKLDRILGVAHRAGLPFVLYAEGGGGRPGDTDSVQGAWLGVPTFRLFARLAGVAPTVAVVHGLSFAGNAALAGVADVVVATRQAVIGMAGPAMVAGGGLGSFEPAELGPVADHAATGAVDVVVADEQEATATARRLVRLLRGDRTAAPDVTGDGEQARAAALRTLVPPDHRRPHDATRLLELVADEGSLVELRRESALGIRTALARVGGRAVGVLANDPSHLAGAIDADAAESAARFIELCDRNGLPIVSLVDTPGFMVGPQADAEGAFRRTGRLFTAGARASVPIVAVVVRRAFGLGAMAMTGGDLGAPLVTVAWPSAELGPMGLEGAVRLGARRELEGIADEDQREARVRELLDAMRAHASALNVASFAEIDDVIDPADTRQVIDSVLGLRSTS